MPTNIFTASKQDTDRLEISVRSACGKLCDYCPQDAYIKNYKLNYPGAPKVLTLETAKACALNIPTTTQLRWTGFTEPFDCEDFPEIVSFFHASGYGQIISTTLLGPKKSQDFFLENLDLFKEGITLHLPDNEGLMKGRFDDRYTQYVSLVLDRLTSKNIPYEVFLIGERLHQSIASTIESYNKEVVQAKYLNTRVGAVNADSFKLKVSETIREESASYYCAYKRLNQGVLLPNGLVALCCQDYGLEYVLGSLIKSPLPELYSAIENNKSTKNAFETGKFSPCNRCEHYRPMSASQTTGRTE